MALKTTRKIGGKKFSLAGLWKTKKEAQNVANHFRREHNENVRVTKKKWGKLIVYEVWIQILPSRRKIKKERARVKSRR